MRETTLSTKDMKPCETIPCLLFTVLLMAVVLMKLFLSLFFLPGVSSDGINLLEKYVNKVNIFICFLSLLVISYLVSAL